MVIEEIISEKNKLEDELADKINAFMNKTKLEVDFISMGDILHDSATGISRVMYISVSIKL